MIRDQDLKMLYTKAKHKMNQEGIFNNKQTTVPNTLILKITTDCNLRCTYCYMGENCESKDEMDIKTVSNIIETFDKMSERPLHIYLHGGEPCLRIEFIKEILSYVNKNKFNNKIILKLQTNGTIISDQFINLVKENNIHLGVSLDSILEKDNEARNFPKGIPSRQKVMENIKTLIDNGIELGICIVVSKYNVKSLKVTIEKLVQLGVKSFVINPLVLWGNADQCKNLIGKEEDIVKSYIEVIDWIAKYNSQINDKQYIQERSIHWWFKSIKEGIKGYMCNCSPCGAGKQTLSFSPKGDVYICDQYYGDPKFCLGNINECLCEDILKNVELKEVRNVNLIEKCKECLWRYVCSGGCTANSYYYYGDMKSEAALCSIYKNIFNYLDQLPNDIIL